jgi:deoxyribonuclease V
VPPRRRARGPLLEAALRALAEPPELLIVNATGRDHPRAAGLSLQLGAVLDLPSIGVNDRPLRATGPEPSPERGETSRLLLLAGSKLGDELLGFVQLAVEPVPLLGRALRKCLARVAGVQLADRGHALPLPGPELSDRPRLLRLAPASQSRPRGRHRSTRYPPALATRRARSRLARSG